MLLAQECCCWDSQILDDLLVAQVDAQGQLLDGLQLPLHSKWPPPKSTADFHHDSGLHGEKKYDL